MLNLQMESQGCIFKVGGDPSVRNPYDGKVALMDEGFNLTTPDAPMVLVHP